MERQVEKDPSGLSSNAPGAKLDANKIDSDLVLSSFSRALIEVCKVGTFGANKYSRGGWLQVANGEERYRSAGLRHWLYEAAGEEVDGDSLLLHKAHRAWNALAELELFLRNNVKLNEEKIASLSDLEIKNSLIYGDNIK